MSHEFRTPLTVIKEYASLVKDGVVGAVSAEQKQMLTVVEDRADDMNTMVDDMLDVSKLEAGLLVVYRKNCQVETFWLTCGRGLSARPPSRACSSRFESIRFCRLSIATRRKPAEC